MADPIATTLVIMYFVTAPTKLSSQMPKEKWEPKVAWTLQSTNTIETADAKTCISYARQLFSVVREVDTMTVRAYCLCPDGDGKSNCYSEPDGKSPTAVRGPRVPTVQRIGPATPPPKPAPIKPQE